MNEEWSFAWEWLTRRYRECHGDTPGEDGTYPWCLALKDEWNVVETRPALDRIPALMEVNGLLYSLMHGKDRAQFEAAKERGRRMA